MQKREIFPLVSIVIPVYNGANYLREAIDSALNQTYPNCEVIVVNDGSTDEGETERAALSYGDKIRYFAKENGKVSTALNLGIKEMRGEFFAWLSHDDVFDPDKIEKQVKVLQETGASIVAASCRYFTDNGKEIPFCPARFYDREFMEKGVFPVIHGLVQFGGVLLRRSLFQTYGVFREELYTTQDYEFLFRVLRKEKCIFMKDIVNGVRQHSLQGTKTSERVEKERDEMYEMFQKELTEKEQTQIYGNPYNFYYQILLRLICLPYTPKSMPVCIEGLSQHRGEGRGVQHKDTVYIYGAGRNGRRLLFHLRCQGVTVKGFLDKNQGLKNQLIDGIPCYTLDEPDRIDQGKKILIASEYREDMAKTLERQGIRNYLYKEDYEQQHNMLRTAPPVEIVEQWIETYRENKWL